MLLFTGTPEWLVAITPTVFGILGWVVAMPLARRFTYPARRDVLALRPRVTASAFAAGR
jgi:hypothetical protein